MTPEEKFEINSKAIDAMSRDDYDEATRLLKLIPLSLVNAKMLAYNNGVQWIRDNGWDLSEVEEKYGQKWLEA